MKHPLTTAALGLAMTLLPALGFSQGMPERDFAGAHLSNESIAPRPQGDWLIPTARPAQQSYTTFPVNQHFASQVGSGCTYHTNVNGTVRMVRTRDDTERGQVRMHPDLVVDSHVSCNDGRTLANASRRITTWPVSTQRLEHLIDRRAELVATEGQRSCTYTPVVALDRDVRITSADVRVTCTVPRFDATARGGGPGEARHHHHHHHGD